MSCMPKSQVCPGTMQLEPRAELRDTETRGEQTSRGNLPRKGNMRRW